MRAVLNARAGRIWSTGRRFSTPALKQHLSRRFSEWSENDDAHCNVCILQAEKSTECAKLYT